VKKAADDVLRTKRGAGPYQYLERVAICLYEGGLSEKAAHLLAAKELAVELPPPTRTRVPP